LIEYSSRCLPG